MVSVNPCHDHWRLYKPDQQNRSRENKISQSAHTCGKSINKASDNAAGLAVATQLLSDVSGLKQSGSNLLQGTALLQTADSSLEQTGNVRTV